MRNNYNSSLLLIIWQKIQQICLLKYTTISGIMLSLKAGLERALQKTPASFLGNMRRKEHDQR